MPWTTLDALFLQAVHHLSRSGKGAVPREIVAYADYLDHIVMTPEEFEASREKLVQAGLLVEEGGLLATHRNFRDWWNGYFSGRKRVDSYREFVAIRKYLSDVPPSR